MTVPAANQESVSECLVIGGGPGGLMTALYLARFKRTVVVVDADQSRLKWIAKTRNVLGFPDGIAGTELLERVRQQAAAYRIPVLAGTVGTLRWSGADGWFEASAGTTSWRAKTVVLATGALDVVPEVEDLDHGLKHALVRYCPVCDGYETQGRRVAVLGHSEHGFNEASFIAGFGNQVTWLSMQTQQAIGQDEIDRLQQGGVSIADSAPHRIRCLPGQGVEIEMPGGKTLQFDMMYSALGLHHASQLAVGLGARADDDGQLEVDPHMQTTVPGLYAVGDVAAGLNQINVAAGQAAIAATAIHNSL